MTAAKAFVAAVTAFLGLLAMREVALNPFFEATLLACIAAATVYITPNRG